MGDSSAQIASTIVEGVPFNISNVDGVSSTMDLPPSTIDSKSTQKKNVMSTKSDPAEKSKSSKASSQDVPVKSSAAGKQEPSEKSQSAYDQIPKVMDPFVIPETMNASSNAYPPSDPLEQQGSLLPLCLSSSALLAWFFLSYLNTYLRRGNLTILSGSPIENKEGNIDPIDLVNMNPLDYKGAGYGCSYEYNGNDSIEFFGYCKAVDGSNVAFGKFLIGNNTCFVLSDKELKSEGIEWYLNFVGESTYFMDSESYHKGVFCRTVDFRSAAIITSNTTKPRLEVFRIGRAVVVSDQCSKPQLLPALYSEFERSCFYGEGVGKPIRASTDCHILCDGGVLNAVSNWTLSN